MIKIVKKIILEIKKKEKNIDGRKVWLIIKWILGDWL